MTYAYSGPLFSDYLLAQLTIKREDAEAFHQRMSVVLVEVFREKLGWKLLRAGFRTSDAAADERQYLHLWQVSQDSDLWRGMYCAGASSSYAQLHRLVRDEAQDLMRLAPFSPVKLEDSDPWADHFAVAELDLYQDWAALCRWRERLLTINTKRQTGPQGWPLYATLRPQTGKLRRQLQIWQIDASQAHEGDHWESAADRDADKTDDGVTVVRRRNAIAVYERISY